MRWPEAGERVRNSWYVRFATLCPAQTLASIIAASVLGRSDLASRPTEREILKRAVSGDSEVS